MVTTRQVGALRAVWDVVRGTSRRGAPGVAERLRAVPRMLWLGLTGRYPHLARGRIAVGMLALLYVLSPVDLVPEIVLPLIGLADDALVATWLAGTVLAETEAFLGWEREQPRVVLGETVG